MAQKEEIDKEHNLKPSQEYEGMGTLMYLSNQSNCYNTRAATHCIYACSKPQHMHIGMVLE
jgi:hypothetical protein